MKQKNNNAPPRWAQRLLRWYCPDSLLEEVEGDLLEAFHRNLEKRGLRQARRQYVADAIRFFNPTTFEKGRQAHASIPHYPVNHAAMWSNHLKIAVRNMLKHRLFSFINIFGLALGLAFVLLAFLFVNHEYSYDNFHANGDNIYRVNEVEYLQSGLEDQPSLFRQEQEGISKYAYLPLAAGPTLQEEYPEVMRYTRFDETNAIVRSGNRVFSEKVHLADSTFFELFDFELLEGEASEVLREKNQVAISPKVASKYFGSENPMGRQLEVITYTDTLLCVVSGIAAEPPANSSLQFGMLLNIRNAPRYEKKMTQWGSFNTVLFVELAEGTAPAAFENKLQSFARQYLQGTIDYLKERYQLTDEDNIFELTLTPLKDIHLEHSVSWLAPTGNPLNVFILSGLALVILLMACLNYISLAVTGAAGRTREVGIRKILGASRRQIRLQFWAEAQLLVLIALFAAAGLAWLLLPSFSEFVQRELSLRLADQAPFLLALLGIAFFAGFIAGGYPAAFVARFKPVKVLKGDTYRYEPRFTRVIVVIQNALSVFLIVSALVMYRQMKFINDKDLGYDTSQTLVLKTHSGSGEGAELLSQRLKNALKGKSGIESVAATSISFNQGYDIRGFDYKGGTQSAFYYRVDPAYIPTLGIELAAGRNFSEAHGSDKTRAVIINERLARDLGMDEPVGQNIPWGKDKEYTIIGLARDYHVTALSQPVQPVMLVMDDTEAGLDAFLIKIAAGQLSPAVQAIEKAWKAVAPGRPFDYTFLDEDVAEQYAGYSRWMSIIGASTLFAILIASLGLFGLAGIFAVNRQKEIGIRKVLGAGVEQILLFLNKGLIRLSLIALLLGAPLAWWAMRAWLANFEYKIDMSWDVFALAGGACLTLALLTVSCHSLRSALANPVDALRNE
ncbi:MAG: ABC transporter permease [Phaeodactylibacter sp.]|nr:ABC transporter permease [Phaeodactylibacter sp.]